MPNVQKNLVVGGMDIRINEHNSKGFCVRETRNLLFNNGFIKAKPPLDTLEVVIADSNNTANAIDPFTQPNVGDAVTTRILANGAWWLVNGQILVIADCGVYLLLDNSDEVFVVLENLGYIGYPPPGTLVNPGAVDLHYSLVTDFNAPANYDSQVNQVLLP